MVGRPFAHPFCRWLEYGRHNDEMERNVIIVIHGIRVSTNIIYNQFEESSEPTDAPHHKPNNDHTHSEMIRLNDYEKFTHFMSTRK